MLANRYKWQLKDVESKESIVKKILQGRNIQGDEAVELFLHPKKEQMHSPYLLNDMAYAIERIQKIKEAHEHIVIYGDYDVGATRF